MLIYMEFIMSIGFKPLYDKIILKKIEQDQKTPGGIIIPDTAKEKPVTGEVLAIGTGRLDDDGNVHPLAVKVGDKVLFTKWGGNEVKLHGEEYIILKESDILGIIE